MRWRAALLAAVLAMPGGVWAKAEPFEIEINGLNRGLLLTNIRARLSIRTAVREQTDDNPLSDRRLRALNRRAADDIISALHPFGYYDAKVSTEFDLPNRRAVYTVETLGPRTTVRDISIRFEGEGKGLAELDAVRSRLQMQPGEPLRHARYAEDKNRVSQAAFNLGFLDGRFLTHDLWVFPDEQAADIEWRFDTGTRWRFGAVTVESDTIDEDVIRRYVRIREGDYFSPKAVLDTQFALTDLGYFAQVDIVPERDLQEADRVPITLRTRPVRDVRYTAGVGYGTDTGARMTAGAEWRRWNRRGHTFRTDLRLSEIQNRFSNEYRIPVGDQVGEFLAFNAGYIDEEFDAGDTERYEIGASLNRVPGSWKRRMYLSYEQEISQLGVTRTETDLLIPGISFTRTELNDAIHPTEGWFLFVDAHGASDTVLSTTTFVQTLAQARVVYPILGSARLLLRGEYGATFNEDLAELPASQRFFAGGDQSVRGYGYRSIGPTDESGENIGGEYLTTFSAELEQPVWGNFGAAVFYDGGGVDNKPGPDLKHAVGAGLRYRAPIGYVNVDLAHPLTRPDTGLRLHLGIRVGL
jgi:translocation and assembly module TamA